MLGSGRSSASIWTPFDSITTATIRPLKAKVLVAWTRQQNLGSYAIVGTSIVGGTDIVQGTGDSIINDADLYDYFDETDSLIRLEYERHLIEPLGGSAIAIATIVLDNTDLRFTPHYDATIGTALKPNRPLKIFIGFEVNGQEVVLQLMEGLSHQPQEDKLNRTVTIQASDFVTFLDGIPQDTAVYQSQRTNLIIASLLTMAGIGSSNYTLDQGINTPAFIGLGVGDFTGRVIQQLAEAEEGIFYQDEGGQFMFQNRNENTQAPYNQVQWIIHAKDILEWQVQQSSQIINHIIVSGKPRSVKGEVEVWRDGTEEEIVPGGTIVVTAQFNDPVTSIVSPSALVDYQALDHPNGAGSDITASVVVSVETFTTTAKITITNNHSTQVAHMWYLKLRGTPATVDYQISETYADNDSIGTYNEQDQTITNDYIQSPDFAKQLASDVVNRYKDPNNILQLKIRGVPQLQLRDQVSVEDMDLKTYKSYRIIGIQGILESGSFTQTLTLREVTLAEAF